MLVIKLFLFIRLDLTSLCNLSGLFFFAMPLSLSPDGSDYRVVRTAGKRKPRMLKLFAPKINVYYLFSIIYFLSQLFCT